MARNDTQAVYRAVHRTASLRRQEVQDDSLTRRRGQKVIDLRGPVAARAKKRTGLESLVDDYLVDKLANNCTPGTIEGYKLALFGILLPWMQQKGLDSFNELTARELNRLRVHLFEVGNTRHLAPATANTYCLNINYFLNWLHREGEMDERLNAATIKKPSRAALVLSDEELALVERNAGSDRNRLIIRILADSGIRVSELCTLRHDRLTRGRSTQTMWVLEKGGQGVHEREVPLVIPGILRRIERYIRDTGGRDNDQPYVFVGARLDRRTGELEPLTPNGVQQMMRHLGERIRFGRPLTPHILRHTFITRALKKGVPETVIAQIVGHKDLRMIHEHYKHTTADDTYEILSKAFARDRRVGR